MQVATIPPVSELWTAPNPDKIHLVLAHMLLVPEYLDYYMKRRQFNDHLILDNGAHEKGQAIDADALFGWANMLNAQEVVMPDILEDSWGTCDSTADAIDHLATLRGREKRSSILQLQYVPQGKNPKEWADCLQRLIALHYGSFAARRMPTFIHPHPIVGISKDYAGWECGLKYLVQLAAQSLALPTFPVGKRIHLLGWQNDLWTVNELARDYDHLIRSIDSAKPWTFARKYVDLSLNAVARVVPTSEGRPGDYFQWDPSREQRLIAWRNVQIMLCCARGILVGVAA